MSAWWGWTGYTDREPTTASDLALIESQREAHRAQSTTEADDWRRVGGEWRDDVPERWEVEDR